MRRSLLVVSLFSLAIPAFASAQIRGAWSALVKGDRVHLNMTREHSNWGRTLPRTDLTIADNALNSATETPVHFAFNRDAGTIDFTGTFLNGEGVGRFNFTPSRSYLQTLQSLAVSTDSNMDDDDLFSLAMHDVSTAFIREMQSLGYRENLDGYIAFRIHGVTADFVRELKSLGHEKLSADDLVAFGIHGVTPQFVREMKALGYRLEADDLVAFRIHGVTADFARLMKDYGVKDLSADQLVAMRIHGVSTDFVRELRDLGYNGLSSDDLVSMRIHGVTTRFIRELADAGYHGIPVDKLVEMRIHGIEAPHPRR
ncbi:MAG TPA: hypothetical protein VER58_00690 [Thermoanaerobaculia bacterium]|nr:hypothetical protein [Thermoanaerobaculia bacterium]